MGSRRGSKPATERPSHRLTAQGRRTATLSPPCSSATGRSSRPSAPSERPRTEPSRRQNGTDRPPRSDGNVTAD
eukprot:1908821-Prymnesium_polylepis.1